MVTGCDGVVQRLGHLFTARWLSLSLDYRRHSLNLQSAGCRQACKRGGFASFGKQCANSFLDRACARIAFVGLADVQLADVAMFVDQGSRPASIDCPGRASRRSHCPASPGGAGRIRRSWRDLSGRVHARIPGWDADDLNGASASRASSAFSQGMSGSSSSNRRSTSSSTTLPRRSSTRNGRR